MKLKKTIVFILAFTCFLTGFSASAVIFLAFNPIQKGEVLASSSLINLKDFIDPDLILYDNLTKISPDNKKVAFVTANDYGMRGGTIWVINKDKTHIRKVASTDNYSYYSNPIWSPDGSKLAYMRLYPFEIYVDNLSGQKTKIYSEFDHKKDNVFNPSQGYGGETYFIWNSNNEIEFENNNEIPTGKYAINVNTKEVRKIGTIENKFTNSGVPWFSQRSDVWGEDELGTCTDQTIHSAGCAVTAIAMVFKYYGIQLTPRELNNMLKDYNNQGYVEGCDVRWNVAQNYADNIVFKGDYSNENNFDRLNYELDAGHPVIVGFDKVPFTNVPHWVVITRHEGSKYFVNDPWPKAFEEKTLDDFGGRFDHMVVYYKK